MYGRTLDEILREVDDLVGWLRAKGRRYEEFMYTHVPPEETNWIDEQEALHERVAISDLSQVNHVHLTGPDAVELLNDHCINDFGDLEVGAAKQAVMCSPEGYVLGDGPLHRLDEDVYGGPGGGATGWLEYNLQTGDYEASLKTFTDNFVFQVQGPDALPVLGGLTDADLDDIGFYRSAELTMAGIEVRVFGHGMSPEHGFEIHGDVREKEAFKRAVLEAGRAYGIRALGSKAYLTNSVRLGWLPAGVPPIYEGNYFEGYRRWLTPDENVSATFSTPASHSIAGSFDSDDIADYYRSAVEVGYGHLIDFDHEFVGRAALEAEVDDPTRRKVSFRWDPDEVLRIYGSMLRDGDRYKQLLTLPRVGWSHSHYDEVRVDGELVGLSNAIAYEGDVRSVMSLGVIDVEHSDPGTTVEIRWGEPDGGRANPRVEDHVQTAVTATVGEAPYTEADGRR